MSYLENEIEHARAAHRVQVKLIDSNASQVFDTGLMAGFNIAVEAFGIWRGGFQWIGANDKTILECKEEFKSALLRTQQDTGGKDGRTP